MLGKHGTSGRPTLHAHARACPIAFSVFSLAPVVLRGLGRWRIDCDDEICPGKWREILEFKIEL